MTVVKIFCDLCRTEIKEARRQVYGVHVPGPNITNKEYDVCDPCSDKVHAAIEALKVKSA